MNRNVPRHSGKTNVYIVLQRSMPEEQDGIRKGGRPVLLDKGQSAAVRTAEPGGGRDGRNKGCAPMPLPPAASGARGRSLLGAN